MPNNYTSKVLKPDQNNWYRRRQNPEKNLEQCEAIAVYYPQIAKHSKIIESESYLVSSSCIENISGKFLVALDCYFLLHVYTTHNFSDLGSML